MSVVCTSNCNKFSHEPLKNSIRQKNLEISDDNLLLYLCGVGLFIVLRMHQIKLNIYNFCVSKKIQCNVPETISRHKINKVETDFLVQGVADTWIIQTRIQHLNDYRWTLLTANNDMSKYTLVCAFFNVTFCKLRQWVFITNNCVNFSYLYAHLNFLWKLTA